MSGAGFILAINMVVAGLLAAAFLTVAVYDRARIAARWLAFAYLTGIAYFAAEASIPFFSDAKPALVFAFALFLAATSAFNIGVARRYEVPVPWLLLAGLFVVSVIAVALTLDQPRESFLRMMIYQAPYVVMQLVAVGIVLSARARETIDRVFIALLCLSALQFFSKPFIAYAVGGTGGNPQAYLATEYAMISQTLGALFGIALALTVLIILARDVLLDFATKSETDTLSGLLNRRGFEQRAGSLIALAAGEGAPVSVVIADLDHFKSINDRFGHASGDRAIEAFAAFLNEAAAGRYVAGRVGGEEFAVLLPGTNLAAARLFAEGARTAFSSLPIEGLPAGHSVTASFGVAERAPGEDVSDFMKRADEALYLAKRAGRNCVRVAGPEIVPMRQLA